MHDSFLIHALCRQVEEIAHKERATRVLRIVIEVGDLSHFTAEHMQDTFEIFRLASPLLRTAELEFRGSSSGGDVVLRDVEMEIPD